MRYLITGGNGFIGSALIRRLVAGGHTVKVLDNNARRSTAGLLAAASLSAGGAPAGVETVEGDIRDAVAVLRAAEGVDSVIHLAYINGTEFFYSKPALVLDVAVRGMLNVLDACREHGIKDLVLASSSEVYQSPPVVPTDESAPLLVPDVLNPRYSYGGGKIISELLALNFGRTDFKRVVIFRPHNVYGPRMGWEHVVPQFVMRMIDQIKAHPKGDLPFEIQGDGTQTRSFIHIDDFVEGVTAVLNKGAHLNIYHVGTTEEVSIRDLARMIAARFGREAKIIAGKEASGGTARRCPDIRKLSSLGFRPRVSLAQGLPGVVDWYVANAARRPA